MFKDRVFIPNRGEIVKRVARTAKKLGFKVFGLVPKGDIELDYKESLDDFEIFDDRENWYLSVSQIINIARKFECGYLHPGYGFLSENSDLCRACKEVGIIFIGPDVDALVLCGDKGKCKTFASKFLPVTRSIYFNSDFFLNVKEILPVVLKVASGGGGRGIRVVKEYEELERAISEITTEAKFFGESDIFAEKLIERAKHVEFQVVAPKNGEIFVLGTRDCSIQRRNQKVIEEAPGSLPMHLYEQTSNKLVQMFKEMRYVGIATAEFLFDGSSLYFLEVNPRIQVEHTVTEEIYGIDLVEIQIKIASGIKINPPHSASGHAIQLRLCAESSEDFTPSFGTIFELKFPSGCRIESTYSKGKTINPNFDNLIAKIILAGKDRDECIKKAILACLEIKVSGIETNQAQLLRVLTSRKFIDNLHTTEFLGEIKNGSLSRINQCLNIGIENCLSIKELKDSVEVDLKC